MITLFACNRREEGPVQAFSSFCNGLGFSFLDMTGFLFVSVHSPSAEPAREKNLLPRFVRPGAKFGFGNSVIGDGTGAVGPPVH